MKYFILFICLSFFVIRSSGQSCYTEFLNKGISAFEALDFEQAIRQFQAAKICDDCPQTNEINDWITKTQSGYIDAIKAARDEALLLKSEAIALRFFVKGQEREFKGFYLEAMDNYHDCVEMQPRDTLFRERRAQLAMSEEVGQYEIAKEDLNFLIANGNPSKRADYNDDLAYVLEQMNDFNGALVAQTSAADYAPNDQKALYESKLGRIRNKGNGLGEIISNPSDIRPSRPWEALRFAKNSFIKIKPQKDNINCKLDVFITIGNKKYPLKNGTVKLDKVLSGTHTYEITGSVSCNGSPDWPAIGKGTITLRNDTVYYLYWERTKYNKCDMWINNY